MPVREYHRIPLNFQKELVDRLVKEWQRKKSRAKQPIILEEPGRRGNVARIYVVWKAWAELDRSDRNEIILDAAEQVKTAEEVKNITFAMGLTPKEADRFGLKWR